MAKEKAEEPLRVKRPPVLLTNNNKVKIFKDFHHSLNKTNINLQYNTVLIICPS